jgi:molecular chaperone GrpE
MGKEENGGDAGKIGEKMAEEDYHRLFLDARKTADEYLTRLKYMQADFENYKKRVAKDKIETIRFANEALLLDLLPVIDELEIALEKMPQGEGKNGIRMVHSNLSKALLECGLLEIHVKEHSLFDASFHEAVLTEKTSDQGLDGKIAKIIQKGYLLNGDVIRYAKVSVYCREEKTQG